MNTDSPKPEILDSFTFDLDYDDLLARVRIQPSTDDSSEFLDLLNRALVCARPKAIFRRCLVVRRDAETVTVDSATFRSPMLSRAIGDNESVYPFVATCGNEMDAMGIAADDYLTQFWLDEIKSCLLEQSLRSLAEHIDREYGLAHASSVSPGSGEISMWPIEQQKELFALLGDVEELIGVRLTETCLMIPNKSVSGIRFATLADFQSCRFCRRENCRNRTVPFDAHQWEEMMSGSEPAQCRN